VIRTIGNLVRGWQAPGFLILIAMLFAGWALAEEKGAPGPESGSAASRVEITSPAVSLPPGPPPSVPTLPKAPAAPKKAAPVAPVVAAAPTVVVVDGAVDKAPASAAEAPAAVAEPEPTLVTLNFADGADVRDVLTAYSIQSGRSVVLGPDVSGEVRLHLRDVPWDQALEVILQPYGFSYKIVGDTVVVSRMEQQASVQSMEPLVTEVFTLRYLDAFGVKEMVESQLSPRGSMSTLTVRGQKGWQYGMQGQGIADSGKRERVEETEREREVERLRSRTIVVTDIPSVVDRVGTLLDEVDVMPTQVLIEARFIEVDTGVLQDIGVQFGTGEGGATSLGPQPVTTRKAGHVYGLGLQQTGGGAAPAAFQPKSSELNKAQPFDAGLSLLFQKLDPTQFEVLLHMLEEEASLNTLSSPRILTLNNEAATIMVGTKYPIIKTEVSGESGSISTTIDYWQDIGIQLNVVPQICEDDSIRMVIHPAVTAQIGTASGRTQSGSGSMPFTDYPVLSTRETETQVILKNAETLAIGGLLKNEEQETIFKVPFLGDIPLIGALFRRRTTNMKQLDLVIFLTATVISPTENVLVAEDATIQGNRDERAKSDADLTAAVDPEMSADMRALLDLQKMRDSSHELNESAKRLSETERERRWREEEKLREELIRRLQKQREKQTGMARGK
jgi:type IV pilus assembly protein PilQ